MKNKVYNCDGYDIHTIKIDKYRTTTISICFRKDLKKEDISSYNLLSRLMNRGSKLYPKKKDMSIQLERLYNSMIVTSSAIEGNTLNFEIDYDFLNPKYCEKNYLEEVMKFLFEIIKNPNVKDGKFDEETYNLVVNQFKTAIEEEKEYANAYAFKRSLENFDINSPSAYSGLGYLEDLEKITTKSLYNSYKKLFTDFKVDVYVAGNIDMDEVVSYIKKYFNKVGRKDYGTLYIDNKTRDKVLEVTEYGNYEQASFIMLYNLVNLTKRERDIVLPIFNSIFGGNELTSKLYTTVREKNSLCYNIVSCYIKYGSLFIVRAGINADNRDKCISLVKKCLNEMINGKFSDDDILFAKKTRINQVKMREDSTWSLINIEMGKDLDNLLSGNKLINEYKSVTKKEIVSLAKKIKLNLIYMLCKEDSNGTN